MAKKKSATRRKTRKKASAKPKTSLKRQLFKALLGVIILIVLVAGVGVLVHYLVGDRPVPRTVSSGKRVQAKPSSVAGPTYEIYPEKETPLEKPVVQLQGRQPKVAIIVDDMGHDRQRAAKFVDLGNALTFSILPYGAHQKEIARKAHAKGCEIMLHLPMEPLEYPTVNPGKGALLTSMSPDRLIEQLVENIDAVPQARGVNNHMGSKLTAESSQMYQVFSVLKRRGLYFVDSRTTEQTLCRPSARLFQVPFAARDIFIDNVQTPEAIKRQLDKLVLIANSHGEAIGICHPYPVTYEVLKEMLPELKKKVRLVSASEVVRIIS